MQGCFTESSVAVRCCAVQHLYLASCSLSLIVQRCCRKAGTIVRDNYDLCSSYAQKLSLSNKKDNKHCPIDLFTFKMLKKNICMILNRLHNHLTTNHSFFCSVHHFSNRLSHLPFSWCHGEFLQFKVGIQYIHCHYICRTLAFNGKLFAQVNKNIT